MANNDRTTAAELDLLARDLEDLAGVTPDVALRRDPGTPALVRRIRDAANAVLAASGAVDDAKRLTFSVQDPENARTHAGRGTKSFGAWFNSSGRALVLSRVLAVSDADNYAFSLFASASKTDLGTGTDTLLATVTCADNGSSAYTADVTTFASDTVPAGSWLIWEHSSGSAESLTVMIEGDLA